MKKLMVICVVAVLMAMSGTMWASITTLDDLLEGGPITSGDKTFSNFRNYSSEVSVTSGTASAVLAADVNVVPYQDVAGDYGLKFTSGAFTITGGTLSQLTVFDYTVTAGAGYVISGNTLAIAGTAADGGITVTENAYQAGTGMTNLLATKVTLVTPYVSILSDSKTYTSAFPAVDVHKSISLYMAGGNNETNTLTEFTQTFSQIPEPATLGVLVLGGLAMLRRRR